ncbi:hypothetical protein [uncultured Roseibium sp.]|uniref:hypothetical protein n=1 Tax=uncultured Roseibium sp. TaxID=1936171 RepID=UPI002625EB4B|nr:hypothetical protein [uncultured Roseibium sp.]
MRGQIDCIAVFVVIVFGTSLVEIVSKFMSGETLHSMADHVARLALSALVLAGFVFERRAQQNALKDLGGQLQNARGQLARIDSRSPGLQGNTAQ